jgi:hypothetical protein
MVLSIIERWLPAYANSPSDAGLPTLGWSWCSSPSNSKSEPSAWTPAGAIYDSNALSMMSAAAKLLLSLTIAGAIALTAAPLSAKEH